MNGQKTFFKIILERKWQAVETLRKFHLFPIFGNRYFPSSYSKNENINSSLFLTTLPAKKRSRFPKFKIKKMCSGPLLISCKNSTLNHYKGMNYGPFEEVPLASKGWHHRKSKGDYFTILPLYEHPAFTSSRAAELPKTFQELGIKKEIIEELDKMGVYNPTVIQAKSIYKLLKGHNILLTAETGCGKTLAYVIPMMESILNLRNDLPLQVNSPFGVILVPSKELAVQVGNVVTQLGSGLHLHCVTLISGDFENVLKSPSVEVTDVIVTTLGIMMRYMESRIYSMERCRHLVMDEADVFFDRNFIPDLRKFLSMAKLNLRGFHPAGILSDCTQLCLTSATTVKNMAEFEGLFSAGSLEVVSTGYLHKVLLHVRQHFVRLNKSQKPETLLKMIKSNEKKQISTLIFSNYSNTCDFLHQFLNENGVASAEIKGEMFSDDRLKAFMNFKDKKTLTVVCTDCLSRGLDMPWVKQVINYDFPNNMVSYIHRCGRVGRLGYDENCLVTNFVSGKNEIRFVKEVEIAARTGRELNLYPRKLEQVQITKKRKRRRRRVR